MTPLPRLLAAVAALAVASVSVAACSGGGGDDDSGAPQREPPRYAFTLLAADVHATVGPAPAFPEQVSTEVLRTLNDYLTVAVVEPLRTGAPPGDLAGVFTPAAAARLAGPDRAALVEEGTPGRGEVRQDRANVRLNALVGPDTSVVVVTAQIDVALEVTRAGARTAVTRGGELVLAADGDAWRIEGYDVRTQRDSPLPVAHP